MMQEYLVKSKIRIKTHGNKEYSSVFDPEGPCSLSPLSPVRSRRQRSGLEGQPALKETQEG